MASPRRASSRGLLTRLPDEIADGEATLRVVSAMNGTTRSSGAWTFRVTSDPLPLDTAAIELMTPVAPGQWTDLVTSDLAMDFEIARVDGVELEFRQSSQRFISRASGDANMHLQVPLGLVAGPATVRTRTWIEQTISDWSEPATYVVADRPVAPTVEVIEGHPSARTIWFAGDPPPLRPVQRGQQIVMRGHFPVAGARELRIQLQNSTDSYELQATEDDEGVAVTIPAEAVPGEFHLVIGVRNNLTPPSDVTILRVM